MSETIDSKAYALYVDGVTKNRDESIYERKGLNNISFRFEKKGVHGILVPKGSGKTELMNIIAGCDMDHEGDVYILDTSVKENNGIKRKIGYVQKRSVFYPDMTVTEVMSFVGEVRKVAQGKLYRQIKEAMELTGIDEKKNRLVRNLNEFEQKKLSLAASLLGNPDILLFDETVTPNMSDERRTELEGIIKMLGKMKTVVLATDDYRIARSLCEDVVIIYDGSVLAKGSFEELDEKLSRSDVHTSLEALYNSLVSANSAK